MIIDELRPKLESYFDSNKGFIILKSSYNREELNNYCVLLRQGGFVYSKREKRTVVYAIGCIFANYDVEKIFYTENNRLVDKVLDGNFDENDESYLDEIKIEKKDTSSIIDKYGLAT